VLQRLACYFKKGLYSHLFFNTVLTTPVSGPKYARKKIILHQARMYKVIIIHINTSDESDIGNRFTYSI